jgi:hypothetical protein
MSQTRRDFLYTSAAALCVTAVGSIESKAATLTTECSSSSPCDPDWIHGDPYLATADHVGLGGRSWEEARDQFARFRMPPDERDRYVLGLEI